MVWRSHHLPWISDIEQIVQAELLTDDALENKASGVEEGFDSGPFPFISAHYRVYSNGGVGRLADVWVSTTCLATGAKQCSVPPLDACLRCFVCTCPPCACL